MLKVKRFYASNHYLSVNRCFFTQHFDPIPINEQMPTTTTHWF
jgi:hypothetical protein